MLSTKLKEKVLQLWKKFLNLHNQMTLEPLMLLDGLGYSIMIVYVENLQMDKICSVKLGYSEDVCADLNDHDEKNLEHQKEFSVFGMYYGVLTAILPLFFILFIGAWSDKYGRKPPLIAVTIGHFMWVSCYLINAIFMQWPVEVLFLAAILDTMGGGAVSFLTVCNAYISDVTKEDERTSRVGLANSVWFLGGPLGTFLGAYFFKLGGYYLVFGMSLFCYACMFVLLYRLPESTGPFNEFNKDGQRVTESETSSQHSNESIDDSNNNSLENELPLKIEYENITMKKMLLDLIDYHRIVDAFKSTFRKREGHARSFILLLIVCNLLRRLGRGAYMYLFTKRVLDWGPTDYGIWVSFKNIVSALGSLVAVPILSSKVGMSDNMLAIIGAFASVTDYTLYALITSSREFFIWLAPIGGLLVNSCVIAIRAMLSKFVDSDELGKVSAVMGALDGVMPMASFSLYTLVYRSTVDEFPGAQFLFGAGANVLCMLIFIFIIIIMKRVNNYDSKDLESDMFQPPSIILKGYNDGYAKKTYNAPVDSENNIQELAYGAFSLANVNFDIGSVRCPNDRRRSVNTYAGRTRSKSAVIHTNWNTSEENLPNNNFTILRNNSLVKAIEFNVDDKSVNLHPCLKLSLSAPSISEQSRYSDASKADFYLDKISDSGSISTNNSSLNSEPNGEINRESRENNYDIVNHFNKHCASLSVLKNINDVPASIKTVNNVPTCTNNINDIPKCSKKVKYFDNPSYKLTKSSETDKDLKEGYVNEAFSEH